MSLGHTCAAAVSDRVLNWHSRLRARSVASPGDIRRTVAHMPRDKPRVGWQVFAAAPRSGGRFSCCPGSWGAARSPRRSLTRMLRSCSTPLLTPGLPGCFKRSSRRRGTPALPSHMSHCQRAQAASGLAGKVGAVSSSPSHLPASSSGYLQPRRSRAAPWAGKLAFHSRASLSIAAHLQHQQGCARPAAFAAAQSRGDDEGAAKSRNSTSSLLAGRVVGTERRCPWGCKAAGCLLLPSSGAQALQGQQGCSGSLPGEQGTGLWILCTKNSLSCALVPQPPFCDRITAFPQPSSS